MPFHRTDPLGPDLSEIRADLNPNGAQVDARLLLQRLLQRLIQRLLHANRSGLTTSKVDQNALFQRLFQRLFQHVLLQQLIHASYSNEVRQCAMAAQRGNANCCKLNLDEGLKQLRDEGRVLVALLVVQSHNSPCTSPFCFAPRAWLSRRRRCPNRRL